MQDGEAWDPYMERRIKLGGLAEYVPTIRRGRQLMFVACGTSYHACLACRQTMEEIAEMPVRCFAPWWGPDNSGACESAALQGVWPAL